jgi:hypothetical protein
MVRVATVLKAAQRVAAAAAAAAVAATVVASGAVAALVAGGGMSAMVVALGSTTAGWLFVGVASTAAATAEGITLMLGRRRRSMPPSLLEPLLEV